MHEQPVFRKRGLFAGQWLPHAERIARRGFYLPSGLAISGQQIEDCAGALKEVLR
jgi:perosamine synthetase